MEKEKNTDSMPIAIEDDLSVSDMRKMLCDVEARMLQEEKIQIQAGRFEIEPTHHFSKGLYAREIFIPKGTLLMGKIHKFENLNIVLQGDISVLTDQGVKRIKAPCTIVSPPGVKRLGYAHEDTIWMTVHATKETDLNKIEDEVIAKEYNEVIDNEKKEVQSCLG